MTAPHDASSPARREFLARSGAIAGMGFVLLGKGPWKIIRHAAWSSRNIAESLPWGMKEPTCRIIRRRPPRTFSA